MKKETKKADISWDIDPVADKAAAAEVTPEEVLTIQPVEPERETSQQRLERLRAIGAEFDMEGLMTDFPTATELQRFVYDQTGIVLNLKGRANRVKYQVAMDTLNGLIPAQEFIGEENPYVDKTELVPTEPLRQLPPRDSAIDAAGGEVTRFTTNTFPHPDPEWRAQDQKCQVIFRKYANNMITYEVLGPIAQRAVGVKINKYGQQQPEKIVWVDARTGEQIVRTPTGQLTPIGTRLKAFMQRMKVNKSNQWDVWIDREFVMTSMATGDNPWAVN